MLVDPHRLAALFVVAVAVISLSGPSVLFVISRAVSLGRAAALATVVGNELGLLVQVSGVAFGLGAIIDRSIVIYTIITLIGAGYLVYLGVQAIRHRSALLAGTARTWLSRSARRIEALGGAGGCDHDRSRAAGRGHWSPRLKRPRATVSGGLTVG